MAGMTHSVSLSGAGSNSANLHWPVILGGSSREGWFVHRMNVRGIPLCVEPGYTITHGKVGHVSRVDEG